MSTTLKDKMMNQRIALTWGDAGENHVGMEIIGNLQEKGTGFTFDDLKNIKDHILKEHDHEVEFVDLSRGENKACVLIIRNYVKNDKLLKLFQELDNCDWDTKYYDRRRKKVLNKRARYNLLFQHGIAQEPDYENGKGTIIDLDTLTNLCSVEEDLFKLLSDTLKEIKSETNWVPLICEGNNYYDLKKCYIGFHGDTERTRVICLSVGTKDYPMQWQWYHKGQEVGEPFSITVNGGDVYIMSEKAVGQDWKKRNIPTLRHGAGQKVMK